MNGTWAAQAGTHAGGGNEAQQVQHLLDGDLQADLLEVDSGHGTRWQDGGNGR